MASPIAHSMSGWTLWLVCRGRMSRADAFWAALLPNLADFDLLALLFVGREGHYWHHTVTHAFAFSLIGGAALALVSRLRTGHAAWSDASLFALLVGSHVVVDYYTIDLSFPHGVPLWWPCSVEFSIAASPIFWNIERGGLGALLGPHNLWAMAWESIVCAPLLGLAWHVFGKKNQRDSSRRDG